MIAKLKVTKGIEGNPDLAKEAMKTRKKFSESFRENIISFTLRLFRGKSDESIKRIN